MAEDQKAWGRFFPFNCPREPQEKAIDFALEAFAQGKKFVVLELPVGVGKSAVGVTIAQAMLSSLPSGNSGAYFITTQKVLADQYIRDFGPSALDIMRSIKSSSNYSCSYQKGKTCAESRRLLMYLKDSKETSDWSKACSSLCPYAKSKQDFISCPLGVTNFPYFLAETSYSKKLEPRHLLIIDEAHNTEAELSKFVEVSVSEKFYKEILKCKPPASTSQNDIVSWVRTTYSNSLDKAIKKSEKELKKIVGQAGEALEHGRRHDMLCSHQSKIEKFLETYHPNNWVLNVVEPPTPRQSRKYEFKPVKVSQYANDVLFKMAEKIVLMSATIIDKEAFCRSLGIYEKDVAFLSLPSPFPKENRPVHFLPIGSMSRSSIDQTLPKMLHVVKEIMAQHSGEKGIIHSATYKVAKYIQENLKDSRLLFHDSSNRDLILRQHLESSTPTVLLSPSMMEGVDLADDASRFQILCKVPFPYLGDAMTKKRMEIDDLWYPYQTAKLVIQSLGRSVRNEKDYATSYILDSDWEGFYYRNSRMFSADFNLSK